MKCYKEKTGMEAHRYEVVTGRAENSLECFGSQPTDIPGIGRDNSGASGAAQ